MRIFLLISVVILTSCSPSQASERILDIQEVTSPSGIKAWLVSDPSVPVISLRFAFNGAGAIRDGADKQGLTILLSNTMDEGAGELKSQEFQKELSDHSISLYFNSGRDSFGGQLKTLTRHKDTAFNLLNLALTKPRFDAEPIERMRQANISRVKSNMGDANWISARLFNDIIYKDHPYALNSGGTLTTLQAISASDLKQYKEDWLTKDRLIVSAAGDITPKELASLLDQIFGGLPASGKDTKIESHSKFSNSGKTFNYPKDIPQTIIDVALPTFNKEDPDYYALQVMNYIYGGGGFGSHLMVEAREKRGLTYGIYSSLLQQEYYNGLTISTSTKNASSKEIVDIITAEMDKMKMNEVEAKELNDAKDYIIGSMPLPLNSTDSISGILLNLQLDDRPIDYLDEFPEKIQSVSTKDIQNVTKRILNPEEMTIIMVGQPEGFENTVELNELPNVE